MNDSGDNTDLLWAMLEDLAATDPLVHAHFTAYRIERQPGTTAAIVSRRGREAMDMLLSLAHAACRDRQRLQDMLTTQAMLQPPAPLTFCARCAKDLNLKPQEPPHGFG